MPKLFAMCLTAVILTACLCSAQDAATSSKPADHVIGTVTAVDHAAHTVTVKEDKTDAEYSIQLQNTKTLLKVEPGAKDLKSATRINASDLAVGDRVDIRGMKTDGTPPALAARSVVLMSARDLQQAHQAEAAAWQQSTAGMVTSVDPSAQTLNITVRTPEGPKPMVVQAPKTTEFSRYAPDTPKTPVPSQLADIQPGDQVRVIGEKSADGSSITAQKLYSGAFRTIAGTVSSIAADGKELTIKNLQTNKPVQVVLTDDSAVRKLPQMMAMGLARQFNPDFKAQGGPGGSPNGGNTAGAPPNGARGGEARTGEAGSTNGSQGANGGWRGGNGAPGGPGGGGRARGGDLSQMLDRIPKIAVSDLKQGDAVLISGAAVTPDNSRLIATNVIAGVEPIFQSAPPRQGGQSLNSGDWGLGEMAIPPE